MWAGCLEGSPGCQKEDHMVVSVGFAHRDGSGLGITRCSEAPASLLVRRKNSWGEVDGPEWELEHSESLAGNWQMLWDFVGLSI